VQDVLLREILNNKSITILELSEKANINVRNTKNNITKLKAKGLLERIGPDKGGYWKVVKGNDA
jgi:ATP-dependent DNA helicase RecG